MIAVLAALPHVSLADDAQTAALIAALGDPTPAKREAASDALFAMGRAAESALEAAANSEDPEIAERATAILERLRFGISASSPPELAKMLAQYRGGSDAQRRAALGELSKQGVPGMRVLAALIRVTHDAAWRDLILEVMETLPRPAAALLIGNGDCRTARKLLTDAAAAARDGSTRDLVAMEASSDGLVATIAECKGRLAVKEVPGDEALLALFERAAGNLPAAREAAYRSGDARLINDVLIEQHDWATAAHVMEGKSDAGSSIGPLGSLAYCQHLSGNAEGLAKTLQAIVAFADAHPDSGSVKAAARILCLNDAPDAAIDLLARHDELVLAATYQTRRLKLREAMKLIALDPAPALEKQVGLRLCEMDIHEDEGNKDLARASFAQAVKSAQVINDADSWGSIARAARAGMDLANADEYLARRLRLFPAGTARR